MGGVEDFADLHKGGFIANVAKGVKPFTRDGDYVEAYGEGYEKLVKRHLEGDANIGVCLLYTSPSPRDATLSRMPSSA